MNFFICSHFFSHLFSRVNLTRSNITFGDNDTLSYVQYMRYTFMPEMSVGAEDDIITTVNLPLMVSYTHHKRVWHRLNQGISNFFFLASQISASKSYVTQNWKKKKKLSKASERGELVELHSVYRSFGVILNTANRSSTLLCLFFF